MRGFEADGPFDDLSPSSVRKNTTDGNSRNATGTDVEALRREAEGLTRVLLWKAVLNGSRKRPH